MTYRRAGLVLAFLALLACSSTNGPYGPSDSAAPSIQFDQMGVLTLAPSQIVPVGLTSTVTPVSLSLAGNYLDAVLESDTANVDPNNNASFVLHAPSSATTFSLLAVSGATSARLDVAVSAVGFATVRVTVDYQGTRPVPLVEASTFVETTCAQLANAPVDGAPLVGETYGSPLAIKSVPTDGRVAVNVRIAHYAVGCMDIASLTPNETRDVTVNVFDLPLDLAHTTLETRFTFTPMPADGATLQSYFDGTVSSAILSASFAPTTDEAGELLDAMATASGLPVMFDGARSSGSWDTLTHGWLGAHPPTMNARAGNWLKGSGAGDLTGHLASDPSMPLFSPKTFATVDAMAAGVAAPAPFTWSGQPSDVLSINGKVSILPSKLACALADLQAHAAVPTATSVAAAMGTDIDCTGLGTTLVPTGYAYGTCDATCVAGLCRTALTNLWSAGAAALSKSTDALNLSITAAAPAQVGDTANVDSFSGAWVGSFSYGTTMVGSQGVAKGAYGTVPN